MRIDRIQRRSAARLETMASFLELKYRGQASIAVRGTITGMLYHFSQTAPVRPVDVRDAKFMLASRLFTISR